MKKIVITFFIIVLLSMISIPFNTYAEAINSAESEYHAELDDIMEQFDIEFDTSETDSITLKQFAERVVDHAGISKYRTLKLLSTIMIITLITAVLKSVGSGIVKNPTDIYGSVSTLTTAAVIAPELSQVFSHSIEAVRLSGSFISVFIPVYAGITAVSGGTVTAGVYDITVLTASELIVGLSNCFMMPLLTASTLLSITGSVFYGFDMSNLVNFLKKIITWFITSAMLLFTGYTSLKCSLAGKADGAATKTARFVISGLVPVVGGAVSDAYSTVRSSFGIIQGTVGTAACFGIILLLMPTVLQILAVRLVMWAGTAISGLFEEEPMTKLLRSLDSTLSIVQSVLICYGMMFILCTAVIMNNTGG